MTIEVERAVKKMNDTKDPAEKAHIKEDIDKMPLSSGELEQAQEREVDRKANDIKVFRESRNR